MTQPRFERLEPRALVGTRLTMSRAADRTPELRGHFEVLLQDYNPLADDAHEEIWIPVAPSRPG